VAFLFFFAPIFLLSQTVSQDLNSNWVFSEAGKNKWLMAKVPGTVHTDLWANGEIVDPYINEKEKDVQWIETKSWEYESTFDLDDEIGKSKHKDLVFEGLDTYAFIYLNDSLLLTTENMFRTYRIDVTKFLKKKKNVLRIVFHPASELIELNKSKSDIKNLPGGDRVFIRKAQYQFGWDFGPRLVTCGIWKPVRLEGWNDFAIRDPHIWTSEISNDTAAVCFSFDLAGQLGKSFHVTIKDGSTVYLERDYTSKDNSINTTGLHYDFFYLPNPRLWWCNGMGKPQLYNFQITVTSGKSHDSQIVPTGIRTIKLITVEETRDSTFYFELNGKSVFIKGANWIPSDNFLPRVSTEKYYSLIKSAQQSNMNMLRVWGGGTYEDDKFYNICDSLGIMVWQDFMFACGMYPYDNHFLSEVGAEARDNMLRLQNHPSLSLWCGNNENEEGWENWDWQKDFKYTESEKKQLVNGNKLLFDQSVGLLEGELLQDNFYLYNYWPTSPMKGWGNPHAYKQGDVHYWGVWWGKEPFSAYDNHVGRFMTEYGFQSMPALSSFKLFDSNTFSLTDPTILAHQKNENGFATIQEYMQKDYPVPTGFSDYIYVSQVMQRDAMTKAIEAHRRAMSYCMGTLFWQYNDCWPGTTWSSIDYYGQPKLLNYALKDLYAPVMVSVVERNDSVLIYVVNEDEKSHFGVLGFQWENFDGANVRTSLGQMNANGESSNIVLAFNKKALLDTLSPTKGVLHVIFSYDNKVARKDYYFVNTKSLALTKDPRLTTDVSTVRNADGTLTLTLTAISLAKNVYLTLDDADSKFSDNGFDLLPNETREIQITTKLSIDEVRNKLKVQTINSLQ
jgi:beta-mannosidase